MYANWCWCLVVDGIRWIRNKYDMSQIALRSVTQHWASIIMSCTNYFIFFFVFRSIWYALQLHTHDARITTRNYSDFNPRYMRANIAWFLSMCVCVVVRVRAVNGASFIYNFHLPEIKLSSLSSPATSPFCVERKFPLFYSLLIPLVTPRHVPHKAKVEE